MARKTTISPKVDWKGKAKETEVKDNIPLITPSYANSGRISTTLSRNIASRKEPDLFSLMGNDEANALQKADEAHYIDRKGKPIYLTNQQSKIVTALAYSLSQHAHEEDIKEMIETISTMEANGQTKKPKNRNISRGFNLMELSTLIYGSSRERDIVRLYKELETLESIKQAQTFYTEDGGKYRLRSPLIKLGADLTKCYKEVSSGRGRKRASTETEKELVVYIEIIFSSLFFHKLNTSFCAIPPTLFQIWGKKGTGTKTELFAILFHDLSSKYAQYYGYAQRAKADVEKAYKDKPTKELIPLIKTAQKKALSYTEKTATLRDRLTTDYESTRAQKAKFIPHLEKAMESLVEIGIITSESHITSQKDKVVFIFSLDYNKGGEPLLLAEE